MYLVHTKVYIFFLEVLKFYTHIMLVMFITLLKKKKKRNQLELFKIIKI